MSKIGDTVAFLATALALTASPAMAQERVLPSAANPGVQRFDGPDLVYSGGPERRDAPLAVFLPGTGGTSSEAPLLLLQTIVQQGYRVVYLSYDDEPAADQICPRQPAGCFTAFREARSFGGMEPPVPTPRQEAIVQRLADLLRYLDRQHPGQGWNAYLTPEGAPAWPRIVLSGLSQGAGMAAFIAKRYPVDRVVLFSSPWDALGPQKRPASWLFGPSATPPERWWAERHVRENTTRLIANAYQALGIPESHVLLFDGGLPPGKSAERGNPYHTSTIRLPQYAPQWRALYGRAN